MRVNARDTPQHEDDALLLARSTLVLASRAAGVPGPVDGVTTGYSDETAVRADAARGVTPGDRLPVESDLPDPGSGSRTGRLPTAEPVRSEEPVRSGPARRQKGMSRITVQTHVTLDGVIESPPEALLPYMSDEGRQATLELALASDALLLGRVTWQHLALAWREQTGAMAERLNAMTKYVVTSALDSAEAWGGSELVTYGDVAALRARLDLLSYGCGALARDLLRDRLLDELHLNVTPVVAGPGRRLFDEPSGLLAFDLVDSRTYRTGAVRLVLRPPARAQDG